MKSILILIILFSSLNASSNSDSTKTPLPTKIIIYDLSFSTYLGKFEYKYELTKDEDQYNFHQIELYESNFQKEKKQRKKKRIKQIPSSLISSLNYEINNPQDSFELEDLGLSYSWFEQNQDEVYSIARKLFEKNWPNSPKWNKYQIEHIKKELANKENITEAVQRRYFNKGIVILHSSGGSALIVELVYPDKVIKLKSSSGYLGLPWVLNQTQTLYNQQISNIIYQLLPTNKGFNKPYLKPQEKKNILESIISKIYQDDCERTVKSLAFHNYDKELNELRSKYELWNFHEQRSGTWNWNGDHRLFMNAKDTNEERNIFFEIGLTIEGNSLYTRDSILTKADRYYKTVKSIPFLLEYLDENPKRKLTISFDNGNSLSPKVKEYQSGVHEWYDGACLVGAKDEYLNQCIAFILWDENNNMSNWFITPEKDIILYFYQDPKVYKYTDKDLGLKGPSIRYACKHFDIRGNIKK